MTVQVMTKDGRVYSVTVRWSEFCGGLFTSERVFRFCMKGRGPSAVMGASAPFSVFREDWGAAGYMMHQGYYADANRVATIPFMDDKWNYL